MKKTLTNKQIILGVTGGIAAYKSADLVRRLREVGASVRVVMTHHAKEFITPLTMQAVSGHPVHDDLFDLKAEAAMGHIELARWADAIIIAPASADFMARYASGESNDLLTTICLAAKVPIVLAPAMNQGMWKNTRTQENVQALRNHGTILLGPAEGSQACGDVGPGRMVEPGEIVDEVVKLFSSSLLFGKRVLITAGPTREAIDPVRYISNESTGKMGYALAEAACEAGAEVTLISGPVTIAKPARVNSIDVITGQEMFDEVMRKAQDCDIFLSVAAVSDYRCKTIATQKIEKKSDEMTLILERNPDIVATVASMPNRPFTIGFAAQTNHLLERAREKLLSKKLDMIIANQVGKGLGFVSDENAVTVLWKNEHKEFSLMSKQQLARKLIDLISQVVTSSS